jgi:hypothetical protein
MEEIFSKTKMSLKIRIAETLVFPKIRYRSQRCISWKKIKVHDAIELWI